MSSAPSDLSARFTLIEIIGVYDASSTPASELVAWVGARLGLRHCGLCAVTHGTFREKPRWRENARRLPVSFVTYHRDTQPDDVRTVTGGRLPMVLARTTAGLVALLDPEEVEDCAGSPSVLVERLLFQLGDWSQVAPRRVVRLGAVSSTHEVDDLTNGPAESAGR